MKKLYKNILNSVEKEHNQNIDKKLNDRVLIIDGLIIFPLDAIIDVITAS